MYSSVLMKGGLELLDPPEPKEKSDKCFCNIINNNYKNYTYYIV